ncbi:MAG: rhomboid family intramembrane serine protease [Thermoanaerobaculia bacterium]|nr:rhomboid family intramembrane serine protease [Thermoanaerobaculia bacterium]
MILLPIGREDSVVRRHAWVFYTILAINGLAFLAFNLIGQSAMDHSAINRKAEEVFFFLAEHPYLEPPEALEQTVDSSIIEQVRSAGGNVSAPPPSIVARQQETLNTLAGELREMVRGTPVMRWAFYPSDPTVVQSITSMFIHADLFHLLGNMLFLFVTAPFIEDVFGRPIFSFLYLSGGLVATWAHVAQSGSDLPLLGASGAVAAIMGAYLVRFFTTRLEFIFIPFILRPSWNYRFLLPAFVFLPFWFGRELWSALGASDSGIAFWAHVGGFAYGAVFAYGLKLFEIEEKYIHPRIEGQISWSASEELQTATRAWRRGDIGTARQQLARRLMENPNDIDARQLFIEISVEEEDWPTVAAQARKLLEQYTAGGEIELGRNLAWDLLPHASRLPTPLLSQCGVLLDRINDHQTSIEFWKEIAERDEESQAALRALIQVLRIQMIMEQETAAQATLDKARAHPLCTGGWREAVEAQAARIRPSGGLSGGRIPLAE